MYALLPGALGYKIKSKRFCVVFYAPKSDDILPLPKASYADFLLCWSASTASASMER